MAGADIRHDSRDGRGRAVGYLAGVTGGALTALAGALLYPSIVLALFVSGFTGSLATVGWVVALGTLLWVLPSLLARNALAGRRKLPWLLGASLVRLAAVGLLAFVASSVDRLSDGQVLRTFFVCYATYALAGGLAARLSADVAVRAVDPHRLGGYLGQRALLALLAAFATGLLVARVLGDEGLDGAAGYTVLFVAAAIALLGAGLFEARQREPRRAPAPVRPAGTGQSALGGPGALRTVGFRLVLAAAALADPFFVVYAVRELGVPVAYAGGYLAALVAAQALAGPLWAAVAARRGTKGVLQGAALCRLLAPLIALTVPTLADTPLWADNVADSRALPWAFGLVYVAIGAALAAQARGHHAYLLDVSGRAAGRPGAAAPSNAVVALAALAAVVGGVIADRFGFDRAFLVAAGVALAAVLASGALPEGAARPRPVAAAWRRTRPVVDRRVGG